MRPYYKVAFDALRVVGNAWALVSWRILLGMGAC